MKIGSGFSNFARLAAWLAGHPASFAFAVCVLLIWAATGPFFQYSAMNLENMSAMNLENMDEAELRSLLAQYQKLAGTDAASQIDAGAAEAPIPCTLSAIADPIRPDLT
jgi:low affinity Fe/Cu permease